MSCQSGKPNLTIVQDSLTGAYLMSKENNNDNTLTNGEFNSILLMVLTQMTNIRRVVEYFLKERTKCQIL